MDSNFLVSIHACHVLFLVSLFMLGDPPWDDDDDDDDDTGGGIMILSYVPQVLKFLTFINQYQQIQKCYKDY